MKLLLHIERHIEKIGGEISKARTSLSAGNSVNTKTIDNLSKKLFSVFQNSFQNSRNLKKLETEIQIKLLIRDLDELEKLLLEANQKLNK